MLFLKVVNPEANPESVNIDIPGVASLASKASAITLAGNPEDLNSISQPRRIVPVTTTIELVGSPFRYTVPAHSVVVLKLKAR